MRNVSDPRQVKADARKAKRAREEELADLHRLMGEPWGRRWMWRLLAKTGVFESSFNPSGSVTYFNEGRRIVGLDYLQEATAECPEEYLLMTQEANARHRAQERDHDDPRDPAGLTPRSGHDSDPPSTDTE